MKSKNTSEAFASGKTHQNRKAGKIRLDVLIVERGLAPSRERAQAMLLAGNVLVNGQKMEKPGSQVVVDARLEIIGETQRYASRGGLKLEGRARRISAFRPRVEICMDVGSSTGGFTDCLLQHGAWRVFAVDVTVDQLDWKLRQDKRVTTSSATRVIWRRRILPERPGLVTMDVSFISVTKVLPAVVPVAAAGADFLILIKPQFELEKSEIGKGGIVRDAALHEKAIERVSAAGCGLRTGRSWECDPAICQGRKATRSFFSTPALAGRVEFCLQL